RLDIVDAITDQAALLGGSAVGVHDRKPLARCQRDDVPTIDGHERVRHHDEPAHGPSLHSYNGALDLAKVVDRHACHRHRGGWRRGLELAPIVFGEGCGLWIEHESDMGETRNDLLEKLKPLSAQ